MKGIASQTLRRIDPESDEGKRLAKELGVEWSPRARSKPINVDAVMRASFAHGSFTDRFRQRAKLRADRRDGKVRGVYKGSGNDWEGNRNGNR